MQDYLAREDPANWYLWIGLLLLAIVFLAPGGLTAWVERAGAARDREAPVMLEVRGLSKQFGSLEVIRDVSFLLEEGARCALIGPNGAGKTTLINLICRTADAERRRDSHRRPQRDRRGRGGAGEGGHRADIPDHQPVSATDRRGERRAGGRRALRHGRPPVAEPPRARARGRARIRDPDDAAA